MKNATRVRHGRRSFGGSVAWAEEAATATTPTEEIVLVEEAGDTTLNTTETTAVIAEAAPVEAVIPAEEEPTLDTGDTAWILTSTALVLLMTIPGLALFYGGISARKMSWRPWHIALLLL